MLPLHDRTRRQIAMLAFVVLCLAPTALVIAYGVSRHLPGHVRHEAERLSSVLGVKVSLQAVEHLRPGVVRYRGLELVDAETGQKAISCQALETRWQDRTDKSGQTRACLLLTVAEVELDAQGLDHVWRLIQEVLRCRADRARIDVRLTTPELTLRLGETPYRLVDVAGAIDSRTEAAQADARFRLADAPPGEAARIRVVRNRQKSPPAIGFAVHTGAAPLPCPLLATAFPELEPLGSQCRFHGYFWANETPLGWDGGLTGQFFDVELERLLVAGQVPHAMRGTVQVAVDEARFQQGRLQQLAGSAVGGQGEISRALVDAAVQHLGLVRLQEVPGSQSLLAFEQLGLRFALDTRGLTLQGQCPAAGSGVILVDRYGPLLGQADVQPQPVASLVRTLVPTGPSQVPATREADHLLGRLPLP